VPKGAGLSSSAAIEVALAGGLTAIAGVEIDRRWWRDYNTANERFAERALEVATPSSLLWVHDYQLMLVPGLVRRQLPDATIGFFLHVPFPTSELFRVLPWRRDLLEGMLGADIVGLQTPQDALAFLPARLLAVLGNSLGTLAVVAVAVSSLGRRPLGNALILLGVGLAAVGTAAGGLGVGGSAVFIALAACALYAGFVARPGAFRLRRARTAVT